MGEFTIDNDFYKATMVDGKWDVQPKTPAPVIKKASGKELPRYKVISEYEGVFKSNFDDMLKKMTTNLGNILDRTAG